MTVLGVNADISQGIKTTNKTQKRWQQIRFEDLPGFAVEQENITSQDNDLKYDI